MKTIRELMLSNRAWSEEMRERKKDYFAQQTAGQKPEIMWIGGSDSRVTPQQITRTRPGELFIHRNLGNLVYEEDDNLMADLQHAVDDFGIAHIVVCGHYGCSGMKAVMDGSATGHMHSWLRAGREVFDAHRDELEKTGDASDRHNRMVELNVRNQLIRLSRVGVVRAAFDRGQELSLHGWVYDMRNGSLAELLQIGAQDDTSALAMPPKVISAEAQDEPRVRAYAPSDVAPEEPEPAGESAARGPA